MIVCIDCGVLVIVATNAWLCKVHLKTNLVEISKDCFIRLVAKMRMLGLWSTSFCNSVQDIDIHADVGVNLGDWLVALKQEGCDTIWILKQLLWGVGNVLDEMVVRSSSVDTLRGDLPGPAEASI